MFSIRNVHIKKTQIMNLKYYSLIDLGLTQMTSGLNYDTLLSHKRSLCEVKTPNASPWQKRCRQVVWQTRWFLYLFVGCKNFIGYRNPLLQIIFKFIFIYIIMNNILWYYYLVQYLFKRKFWQFWFFFLCYQSIVFLQF